jgi:hypothetical protein
MRRPTALILTALLGLGLAGAVGGATVEWAGTLEVQFLWLDTQHLGTGVATVNGSAAGGHINTIRWTKGLSFWGGNNVPETVPLTDPANPTLVSLWGTGIRLGNLTLNGISGGPPLGSKNTGAMPGQMILCILLPTCPVYYFTMPFATPSGNVGAGVGGSYTVNGLSKGPGIKLSIYFAPWTIGVASIPSVTTKTPNGAITTYTKTLQGFVHGPASGTSSTAALSGVLQVVTPVRVETTLSPPHRWDAAWVEVRLHFIPEPGLLLLLGSGVAGLLLLGRRRIRE